MEQELSKFVGLDTVKTQIRRMFRQVIMDKLRKQFKFKVCFWVFFSFCL